LDYPGDPHARSPPDCFVAERKSRGIVLYDEKGLKNIRNVFEKCDEVREGLLHSANTNRLADGQMRRHWGIQPGDTWLFDRERKDNRQIPIDDQIEVLSFSAICAEGRQRPPAAAAEEI